jgi:hypothetical protein
MRPPDRHQVHHAAAPDQQDVLRRQIRPDIRNAGLGEQREHAEIDVLTAGENLGDRFNGGRGIAGSRGDEADPFLPVASGEAHRVLKECWVTLLAWEAVQDAGEGEHLSGPAGHLHSLTILTAEVYRILLAAARASLRSSSPEPGSTSLRSVTPQLKIVRQAIRVAEDEQISPHLVSLPIEGCGQVAAKWPPSLQGHNCCDGALQLAITEQANCPLRVWLT